MTDYAAYDAGLPCQNRSCKSYGTPHPNCRCYSHLAEGGDAHFCAATRPHDTGCEYFAEGGDAGFWEDDAAPAEAPAVQDSTSAPAAKPEGFWENDALPEGASAPKEPFWEGDAQLPETVRTGEYWEGLPEGSKIPDEAWQTLGREYDRASALPFAMTAAPILGAALEVAPGMAAAESMGPWAARGAEALKGAISSGLIQGTDEIAKHLLGQGDPQNSVGAILAASGLGAIFGVGAGELGRKIESSAQEAVPGKWASWLSGFGSATQHPFEDRAAYNELWRPEHDAILGPVGGDFKAAEKGQAAYDQIIHGGIRKLAGAIGATAMGGAGGAEGSSGGLMGAAWGAAKGVVTGWLEGQLFGWPAEKFVGWASKKYLGPVTLKIMSSGTTAGLLNTLSNADKMVKGFNMVARASDAALKGGSAAAIDSSLSPRELEQADAFIGGGGEQEKIQQQIYQDNAVPGFAEGGEVHKRPAPGALAPILDQSQGFATHYPAENMALHTAKGRISSYLQGLRPGGITPKLAFDRPAGEEKKRKTYERALHLAAKPLGILEEVRKGTLQPEHMQHFDAMHPELGKLLRDHLAQSITHAQLRGEKPPARVRQGLSQLLGTPLSSEFSPAGIQAVQAVFQAQRQQQQPQQGQAAKPKKSTAPLSKADKAYLTGSQARDMRQQKV